MSYGLKALVGTLRPRFILLIGQSSHVGFRHDRIVRQESLPKYPACRVVFGELDTPHPFFYFGYLQQQPTDESLVEWLDFCLNARSVDKDNQPPNRVVVSTKLSERYPLACEFLASRSLHIVAPLDGFDAGAHLAKSADNLFNIYVGCADDDSNTPVKSSEGWITSGLSPILGATTNENFELLHSLSENFVRRHRRSLGRA